MTTPEDNRMQPKPDCDFDLKSPHAADTGEGALSVTAQPRDLQRDPNSTAHNIHGDESDNNRNEYDRDNNHNNHESMEDVVHTTEPGDDLDYGTFPKGFSDDEDTGEAFDRSWQARKPKMALSNTNKKSPRRLSDIDDELSPTTKRPRQSLFGGPEGRNEEEQLDGYVVGRDDCDANTPNTPGQGIRHCMSSLNFDQEEQERPFSLGFGLASSDRDSLSPPRASPAASEESVVIPPDDQPMYELRQNIERKKAFTYIDTDKSGNFDPSEEAKKLKALKLNKMKAAKAVAVQQKKGKDKARAKEPVMKHIVKLPFEAFGNVRNYTNDEDNWPEAWSEIDSDWEREVQEYRDFFRQNTPGLSRERQTYIEDPGGDVDDLTGYPAARGCRNCRKHEQECTMIHGGTYPCQQCLEDDCDCEPILSPTLKGQCRQCVEDGQGKECSFADDPDQAICDHCAENEYICDALPPDGYRAKRIDIYEHRQYVACTVCRQEKKRCSLKKKSDTPPCKYCKKHNIGCTFYDLPKAPKKQVSGVKGPTEGDAPEVAVPSSDYFTPEDLADMAGESDDELTSRESTPELEMEMEDAEGHKGVLIKITTSYAHPIQFNTLEQVSPDCNFCEIPIFSFTGYMEKTVHVLKWNNGLGYSEIAAGHREDGNDPTTMCQECVMDRVQIICCSAHEIQRMHDTILDFDEAANDLMLADPRSPEMRYQLQRWCSMCFSLAAYKCCSQGEVVMDEVGEEDAAMQGCGFRLCATCETRFRVEYGGDADAMVAAYDQMPKMAADTPDGTWVARADVGLLRKEGLLMTNVERDAQNGVD